MKLVYLTDKEQLNAFIRRQSHLRGAEFLESWEWGDFLISEGAVIKRVGLEDEGKLIAVAILKKQALGAGRFYWYAPRGPIVDNHDTWNFFIEEIKKIDPRAAFIRIEPEQELQNLNFTWQRTLDLQPRQTLMIDLELPPERLLANMHQKTRYNIRLAEKKGVEIRLGDLQDFPEFWRLLTLTSERDHFNLHTLKHYENLLNANKQAIKLFLASYQGQYIAAGLFSFWGNKATYLHGASDNRTRHLMAPYLLQWEVIKQAQAAGCKYYDFYGINEKKWPGVTRFKLGFGGNIIDYPGTFDIIFQPYFYRTYLILRGLRRLLKKYFSI